MLISDGRDLVVRDDNVAGLIEDWHKALNLRMRAQERACFTALQLGHTFLGVETPLFSMSSASQCLLQLGHTSSGVETIRALAQ